LDDDDGVHKEGEDEDEGENNNNRNDQQSTSKIAANVNANASSLFTLLMQTTPRSHTAMVSSKPHSILATIICLQLSVESFTNSNFRTVRTLVDALFHSFDGTNAGQDDAKPYNIILASMISRVGFWNRAYA